MMAPEPRHPVGADPEEEEKKAPSRNTGIGEDKENDPSASRAINQQRIMAPVRAAVIFTPSKRSAIDGVNEIGNQEDADREVADASHLTEHSTASARGGYGMASRVRNRQNPKKQANNNLNPHFAALAVEQTAAYVARNPGSQNVPMSAD